MKHSSTTFTQLEFRNTQTIPIEPGILQTTLVYIKKRKKQLLALLQTLGAIMGVGCLFFISIYLFFIQLAKYGWQ